jgi:outer membrane protein assembly factor BamB
MLKSFDCPKCGGPVSYEAQPILGSRPTVRCTYCNSSLYVPDDLHGEPARIVPINIHIGTPNTIKVGKWIWLIVAIPAFGVIIAILAMIGALAPVFYSINRAIEKENRNTNTPISRPLRPGDAPPADTFARVMMKFGSEGIGPGMFTDARSIAVDGTGKIYVGEYTGGRIQVFDPDGKFLTQWSIGDRKTLLRGLAADPKGIIYVVTGGEIRLYAGSSGQQVDKVDYPGGFDDVAAAPDGGFIAAWYRNRDDLVRFKPDGQHLTIPAAISSTSGDSELNTRVAIDGAGNIYALGLFNEAVFKFSPEGKFMNRFGGEGNQPGQIRAASAIAVDGKGRIFVSDVKGIQVFDANGRYLQVFSADGPASGMVFNYSNELFVVARKHVIKFSIKDE